MKPRLHSLARVALPLAIAIAALLGQQSASAGPYSWNQTATPKNWSDTVNWSPVSPSGGPSSAGNAITINTNITADAVIDLALTGDGFTAAKIVGTLNIGDLTSASNKFTLQAGTGSGSLVMNNNGSGAQINELTGSKGDVISADIQIADAGGLTIANAATNIFSLTGTITSDTSGRNLILNANTTGAITLTTVNNQGTITTSSSGAGTTTITTVGSNVTGVTQNSAAALTVATWGMNTGGTKLISNNTGLVTVQAITGTGNLTINANNTGNCTFFKSGTGTTSSNVGTITNSGSGTNTVDIGGGQLQIGTGVTDVIQNSTTSTLYINNRAGVSALNTGMWFIKSGTLKVSGTAANPLSTGPISLGDSTGSNPATLLSTAVQTFPNPIGLVANPNSGLLTISGASNNGTVTFTGGVFGTNNLVVGTNIGSQTLNFSTNPINITGTITNNGTLGAGVSITGGVGGNVTGVIQNSPTGMTISNVGLTINSGGTTLTDIAGVLTVSSGVTGTGNLTLRNNSATANGINLSTTAVNNIGTITNAGTGTGSVTIAAVGSNVTNVIQNSNTSPLTITTLNALTTTLTSSGTALLTVTNQITGVGALVLSPLSGSGSLTLTGGANNTGPIINTNTSTGTLTIGPIGTNVNGVLQDSPGTMILAGANGFTGGLTVSNGTVIGTTSSSAFGGNGTGQVTLGALYSNNSASLLGYVNNGLWDNPIKLLAGGNLKIGSNLFTTTTFRGGITGPNNFTIVNGGGANLAFTTAEINNAGTISNGGTGTGTTTISAPLGTNVTGIINAGAGNLAISGVIPGFLVILQNSATSTLTLSNPLNSFIGGIYIKLGTLSDGGVVGSLGALDNIIYLGDSTPGNSNNATYQTGLNATGLDNPIIVQAGSSGTLTIKQSDGSNANGTVPGTITLNNNLMVQDNSGYNKGLTLSGAISGTGNITIGSTSSAAYVTLSNLVNNIGTITNTSASSGPTTFSGTIGNNVQGLIQNATAPLVVNRPNGNFIGNTTVITGILSLQDESALINSVLNINGGALTIGGGGASTMTALSLGGLAGTGNIDLNNNATTPAAVALTIGNSNISYGGNTLNPSYAGILSGPGSLDKIGSNIQTLTGPNSYTGGTTVTNGTLMVNNTTGSGTGSGAVTVDWNLGGSGKISGPVTVDYYGLLMPGAPVGTLATGALTMASTSGIDYENNSSLANSVGFDLIKVNGGLTFQGDVALTLTDLAAVPVAFTKGETFTLVCYTGNLQGGGAFTDGWSGPTIPNGTTFTAGLTTWRITYDATTGGLNFPGNYGTSTRFINITTTVNNDVYTQWATDAGLSGTDALAAADPDHDGLNNLLEFVVGGQPNPARANANSVGLLPGVVQSSGNVVFTFRRAALALTQPGLAITPEYSATLGTWVAAQDGVNGVTVVITPNGFSAGVDKVVVTIPQARAVNGKLFARLHVTSTP